MNTTKARVMIVDDHADVRTPICLGLEIAGFEVLQACDGQSAIDIFDKSSPDVVIIDQGLPDMVGIEVGRAIRNHTNGKSTVLALLSGSDGTELRQSADDLDFKEFFLKPISIRTLGKWIESVLED